MKWDWQDTIIFDIKKHLGDFDVTTVSHGWQTVTVELTHKQTLERQSV